MTFKIYRLEVILVNNKYSISHTKIIVFAILEMNLNPWDHEACQLLIDLCVEN